MRRRRPRSDRLVESQFEISAGAFFVRAALSRLRRVRVHRCNDIRPIHDGLGQASGHSRRDAKCLVNAYPVVPNRPDRHHVRMALELLREGVGKPGEAAIVHPHREVRPLAVARRNVLRVGLGCDRLLLRADAFGWAVAAVASPDFPGERLIVCRNPDLARERARKREDLIAATERDLAKIAASVARMTQPLRGPRSRSAWPPARCSTSTRWPSISS